MAPSSQKLEPPGKSGRFTVSEGDQYWSAVENFAGPLGLVKPGSPRYLDPESAKFYREIKQKVEDRGGAGLEIKTVYNWFTGYDPKDGQESPGLTRRMVDIYLLAMAQQGVIRISDRRGGWLDRATIAGIDFKPETLRNLTRIELPRALDDWPIFSPYLEVLTGKPAHTLGPKYDKATADDALKAYWEHGWWVLSDLQLIESHLRELFRTLGKEQENTFEELLLYWIQFADEPKPASDEPGEIFDALRRAVLAVSAVSEVDQLTSAELTTFRDHYRQLQELKASFDATRIILLQAARLARAPLPDDSKPFQDIAKAQREVSAELDQIADLVVNPATVQTRLTPRLQRLKEAYVPAYLDELMALDSVQAELDETASLVTDSTELEILRRFTHSPEAKGARADAEATVRERPPRLRRHPEDRDTASRDVGDLGYVRDILNNDPLTLRKLVSEITARTDAKNRLEGAGQDALDRFAGFLYSPRLIEGLAPYRDESPLTAAIVDAKNKAEVSELLLAASESEHAQLARILQGIAGGKKPKSVRISEFKPSSDVVWEQADISTVVSEFQRYLEAAWEQGAYLKLD